jgi:hypothetical protein
MDAYAGAVSRQAVPLAAPRLCQVNQAGCGSGCGARWPTLAGRHHMAGQGMTAGSAAALRGILAREGTHTR